MLSTLRKILKHFLCLSLACLFFSTSALADPSPGKKINLNNQNSSSRHYYTKIRLLPATNIDVPPCSVPQTGMMVVDLKGNLYICNGTIFENVTSPWDRDDLTGIVYPKEFLTTQVAIGSNTIPNNLPLELVKFYLSQPNDAGLNQIEFKPTDENGNTTLEMYTAGAPAGAIRSSTYFNFLVGDRPPLPPLKNWDARIEYFYNPAVFSGLKFIGQRKTNAANANNFTDLKIYADGRVDFGSDETSLTFLPPLPPRNARKVKVYGNTKTDSLILDHDGVGPNPALPLKVEYHPAGAGGYYAVYSP